MLHLVYGGILRLIFELSDISSGLTERVLNDHPELFSEKMLNELATMSDAMCIQVTMHWCDRLIQCESEDMLHILMGEALNDLKGDGHDYSRMEAVITSLCCAKMEQLEKSEKLQIIEPCSRIKIIIQGAAPSRLSEYVMGTAFKLLLDGDVESHKKFRRDFEDGIFEIKRNSETPLTDAQKTLLKMMAGLEGVEILFY